MRKRGKVCLTTVGMRGGMLRGEKLVLGVCGRVGLEKGKQTHGGSSRFGRRSMSTSPSLGGGMRFSGDHTLVGVFQGTTGLTMSLSGGTVDANRATTRRR
jgi:hypothetical protein